MCHYPKYILTNQYVVWVEHPFQTQWHRKQRGKWAMPPSRFCRNIKENRSRNRHPTKDSVRWNNFWLRRFSFFLVFFHVKKHRQRFVILSHNSSECNLSWFFDIIKPRRKENLPSQLITVRPWDAHFLGNGKTCVAQISCNLSYLIRQRQDHQKIV